MFLKKKVFYYDNKYFFIVFCIMGFNIIMDKYFKFVDFIWIILWIFYNIVYWFFLNFIYMSFFFRRKF